jgi:iron complex outermembrane receptor protein
LNESGTVGYRLSGSFQDYGSFKDFQDGRRVFLAPVLAFNPTNRTDFIVDLQYLRNDTRADSGIPAFGNRPAPIPLRRSLQEANELRDWVGSFNGGYELTHRFNDQWAITNRFLVSTTTLKKWNITGTSLDEATGILDRATQFQKLVGTTYSTNLNLTGRFETWGVKHTLLIGGDYLHDYYDYNFGSGSQNFPINIFNPVYGTVPSSAFDDGAAGGGGNSFSSVLVKQTGAYVQDQLTIADRLHLLLGGRYDYAEVQSGASPVSREAAIADRHGRSGNADSQFSPRVGLLYQWTPRLSTYGSYSKSFGANNGRSSTGEPLPPERGEQFEVGTKAELFQGLSATVALFHLTKKKLLTPDLTTPDPTDARPVGEARSQGVEIDLLGTVTTQLNLIVTYAYLDTKVTRDDRGLQGNRLDNVPSHSGRVFLVYHFGGEDGLGWRVGGGVSAASTVSGDRENTFNLPAYYRLDAMASYSAMVGGQRLTAQLNLRNLTNTKYFDGTDIFFNAPARFGVYAAQPLMAIGTIRMEF